MIQIDRAKCVRCGTCAKVCIAGLLRHDVAAGGLPRIAPDAEKRCLNCQHCLAACPAGAIICNGVTAATCPPLGDLPPFAQMLNLLRQRRSVRKYKNENLDRETLEKLKSALAWTPTGCNDHRLFFAVVEDKSDMEFFRNHVSYMLRLLSRWGLMRFVYPGCKHHLAAIMAGHDLVFRNAPHMIVAATPVDAPCAAADPWIALSYFDTLAQTLGVGTCWCGFAVHAFRWSGKLRRRLHLPPNYRVGAVMLFGTLEVSYARATMPPPFAFADLTKSAG